MRKRRRRNGARDGIRDARPGFRTGPYGLTVSVVIVVCHRSRFGRGSVRVGAIRPVRADELRRTLAEFDAVWSSMTTKEQEQMIHLLVAKVGYDGRTGKVAVNFSNTGVKELCQGKC